MNFHPILTATEEETALVELGHNEMMFHDPVKALDLLTRT
jgi:hypothetical protein